jgi:histidinol-phosphatase
VDRQVLELAVDLAYRGGLVAAERFFAADFSAGVKADGSEVTDADWAVEELIRDGLQRHCPGDGICGEEGGVTAGRSGRRWVIDPIDGTAYFAHRIPLFSTVLAYEDEHGPAASVISYPVAQQIVFAGRGLGCWVRTGSGADQPATLRPGGSLRQARIQLVNPGTWHSGLLMALHQNVTVTGYLGGIAGVLTGLLDAIVMAGFPQGYEDLAPLPVLLSEAGGMVTDLSGGPVLAGPGTALISTGHRHREILDLIAHLPHGEPRN